jgi:hypothetical protein
VPELGKVTPWLELEDLDGRFPRPDIWPPVTPADLHRQPRTVPEAFIVTAQSFALQHGRFDGLPVPRIAPVVPMLARPALGSLRGRHEPRGHRVSAPVQLGWNRDDADRYDRTKWQLDAWYRRMWRSEPPSTDNRDMWRAYSDDGRRRWARP